MNQLRFWLVGLACTGFLTNFAIADDDPATGDEAQTSELQQSLLGAWALAGELDSTDEPEAGARMKFWGLKHWCITETDQDTGEITYHHGGTYTLDGDNYSETITFAAENTKNMVGMTLKFKIKVDKDTYLQTGVGNPFNERWVRLK